MIQQTFYSYDSVQISGKNAQMKFNNPSMVYIKKIRKKKKETKWTKADKKGFPVSSWLKIYQLKRIDKSN